MSKSYIGPSRYRLKPVALVGTFDHAIDNLYHVFLTQPNILCIQVTPCLHKTAIA